MTFKDARGRIWTLKREARGRYTANERYRVVHEDPFRPKRGWHVRDLLDDPNEEYEPIVLDNGLTYAPTMRQALSFTPLDLWPERLR